MGTQGALVQIHQHCKALAAHIPGQLQRLAGGLVAQGDDKQVCFFRLRVSAALCLHQQLQPLQSKGEAQGRGLLAAQFVNQAVVAPAAAHGALGTNGVGHEFKYCLGVIVQPADNAGVYDVVDILRF